jgi:hypothetical protein
MSRLAKSTIEHEKSKPILNNIINMVKKENKVQGKYYYLNIANSKKNSFEEKSSARFIALYSDFMSVSIILYIMCMIHNWTFTRAYDPTWPIFCSDKIQKPEGRFRLEPVEIYTLDNIWDVLHSRNI